MLMETFDFRGACLNFRLKYSGHFNMIKCIK